MSPDLAGLIKEALGPRIDMPSQQAEDRTTLEIPGQPGGLETIQERLQGKNCDNSDSDHIKLRIHVFKIISTFPLQKVHKYIEFLSLSVDPHLVARQN